MQKRQIFKSIALFLVTVNVLFMIGNISPVAVLADVVDDTEAVEEEIDPKHIEFVRRLYAIVTRQMHADNEEKLELAKSLEGGISAAAFL